jgi:putative ABC transport system substrate-binding protein
MKRREFITLLGGTAVAWPLAARAQQPERVRRVGGLMGNYAEDDPESRARMAVFRQAMEKVGWTDKNIQFDFRWRLAEPAYIDAAVKEMVAQQPDVILALSTSMVVALKRETITTPIVFVNVTDPIGSGVAVSLARPGGNFTGLTHFEPKMAGKWLDLLKQMAPAVTRVAVLYSPKTLPPYALFTDAINAAAPTFAIHPTLTPANDAAEIERAIEAFAVVPNGSLLVVPDITASVNRGLVIALAARHRLPAIYPFSFFTREGGLMSYGVDAVDQFRQLAGYTDRILRGAKPADLPIQTPTKFELIVNLKTARTLGLTVPLVLQVAADEMIE